MSARRVFEWPLSGHNTFTCISYTTANDAERMYRWFSVNYCTVYNTGTFLRTLMFFWNGYGSRARTVRRESINILNRVHFTALEKRVQRENVVVYLSGTRPCKYSSKKKKKIERSGPETESSVCVCVCGLSLKSVYTVLYANVQDNTAQKKNSHNVFQKRYYYIVRTHWSR